MTGIMRVQQLDGRTEIDSASGSLVVFSRFRVQRREHHAHVVEIEITESGTPQNERCDCQAYRFTKECSHIDAVYASGQLNVAWD